MEGVKKCVGVWESVECWDRCGKLCWGMGKVW